MNSSAGGPSDDDGDILSPTKMTGRREIRQLIKGARDEVDELHLNDRFQAGHSRADRRTDQTGFNDGGID